VEKTATAVLNVHKMNGQQDCLPTFQTLSSELILMAHRLSTAPVLYYTHLKIHPVTTMIIITREKAIWGTTRIGLIEKVLMCEYEMYHGKLYVPQTVNTEQLQHYIPQTHCLFQVYNCKYPA